MTDFDNQSKYNFIFNQIVEEAIYDVTMNNPTAGPNNNGKWESLSALLSDANLSILIPN